MFKEMLVKDFSQFLKAVWVKIMLYFIRLGKIFTTYQRTKRFCFLKGKIIKQKTEIRWLNDL